MTITELVLLGLALSMDAFAVTISNTFIYQGNSRARNILMPIAFGLFQGLMPCVGYILGRLVSDVISQYAGIITFAILGFIGAKMIWDALHEEAEMDEESTQEGSSSNSGHSGQILTLPVLTLQAIATSIDALAVGVSFAALSVNVAFAAGTIALTTALTCGIALVVGRRFGNALGERATIIGGIVLILIGLKSLLF
ncbi:MAG: manganese efflux pump MntP family protein [Eggerthellaceae bacterium]|nr:manganese efflux pump MntP family protein [Eggerthellaceae bacterium]